RSSSCWSVHRMAGATATSELERSLAGSSISECALIAATSAGRDGHRCPSTTSATVGVITTSEHPAGPQTPVPDGRVAHAPRVKATKPTAAAAKALPSMGRVGWGGGRLPPVERRKAPSVLPKSRSRHFLIVTAATPSPTLPPRGEGSLLSARPRPDRQAEEGQIRPPL